MFFLADQVHNLFSKHFVYKSLMVTKVFTAETSICSVPNTNFNFKVPTGNRHCRWIQSSECKFRWKFRHLPNLGLYNKFINYQLKYQCFKTNISLGKFNLEIQMWLQKKTVQKSNCTTLHKVQDSYLGGSVFIPYFSFRSLSCSSFFFVSIFWNALFAL